MESMDDSQSGLNYDVTIKDYIRLFFMAGTQIPMSAVGLKAQVAVGDGSVGGPSIGFSNDVNTGLYRPAADVLGVVTGGVERMRVGSNGYIQIGNSGYAGSAGFLSAGSIAIGNTNMDYGGGSNGWNSNTAGILMECANNTELAIHDYQSRISSILYYQGGTTNRFTVGRDMGWGVTPTTFAGDVSIQGVPYTANRPSFFVRKTNGGQAGAIGVIVFNDVVINVGSYYNATTGRYTPGMVGKYFISMNTSGGYNGSTNYVADIILRKNGVNYAHAYSGQVLSCTSGSAVVDMNGTTDFIDVYAVQPYRGDVHTWFTGYFIG